MESILEVMHTVWDSVLPELRKEENKAAKTVIEALRYQPFRISHHPVSCTVS